MNARQQNMLKEMGIRLPWAIKNLQTIEQTTEHPKTSSSKSPNIKEVAQVYNQTSQASPVPTHIKEQVQAASTPRRAEVKQAPITTVNTIELDQKLLAKRAQEITTMSWQELEEAAQQCDACSLCKTRKKTVFSAGIPTAQWMIVGEAPGEQEDKQGEPFVGPAGQLLDRMLQQLGLSRSPSEEQKPVYIANVLKCRPPRNRNPEPHEVTLCQAFLKRQIELVQPKVILITGRFAVQTLLNTQEAIGRMRGQIHDYNGIPAIVTYHPAYLLRNPVDKRKSWEDLCLAAQTLHQRMAHKTDL